MIALKRGFIPIMEMLVIPKQVNICQASRARPDKARDSITAATQHTCTIFASSCAESSISYHYLQFNDRDYKDTKYMCSRFMCVTLD